MRIGDLAARAGVSVRALRYYEEQGLLVARRSTGGHRHFPERAVEQVALIRQFLAAGVSSRVIQEILPSVESGAATPEALALLTAEQERLSRRAADLTVAQERLADIIGGAETSLRGGRCHRNEANGFGDQMPVSSRA
jgi:DNA-binding transcriptional MerR regulator